MTVTIVEDDRNEKVIREYGSCKLMQDVDGYYMQVGDSVYEGQEAFDTLVEMVLAKGDDDRYVRVLPSSAFESP